MAELLKCTVIMRVPSRRIIRGAPSKNHNILRSPFSRICCPQVPVAVYEIWRAEDRNSTLPLHRVRRVKANEMYTHFVFHPSVSVSHSATPTIMPSRPQPLYSTQHTKCFVVWSRSRQVSETETMLSLCENPTTTSTPIHLPNIWAMRSSRHHHSARAAAGKCFATGNPQLTCPQPPVRKSGRHYNKPKFYPTSRNSNHDTGVLSLWYRNLGAVDLKT